MKHGYNLRLLGRLHVAPPAGAWIETDMLKRLLEKLKGRAPRGRVD